MSIPKDECPCTSSSNSRLCSIIPECSSYTDLNALCQVGLYDAYLPDESVDASFENNCYGWSGIGYGAWPTIYRRIKKGSLLKLARLYIVFTAYSVLIPRQQLNFQFVFYIYIQYSSTVPKNQSRKN